MGVRLSDDVELPLTPDDGVELAFVDASPFE